MTAEQIIAILQAYVIKIPVTVAEHTIQVDIKISDDLAADMAQKILAIPNG